MIRNKFLSRKFLISLICILFLVLFAFLMIDGYFNLNKDLEIHSADVKDMIDQRIASLLFGINVFPQDMGDNLLFLSKLSSLRNVINSAGEDRENKIKELEKDFLRFLKGNVVYYQLRYIDKTGQEIVRAEFNGNNYKIIAKNKLQNKAHRYYFNKTIELAEDEIYISQLDLNIENKMIENRGTEENPVYVPVMRVATPVFDNEELKGIVLFNVYADYFLKDIRRSKREGETVFLINKEGYYLAHPNKTKEFAFIFDKEDNFYNDYPEIPEEILLDFNKRRFETKDLIFSFRYIYPTVGGAGIHSDLGEDYSWILVTISEKTEMYKIINKFKSDYLYFLLFSGLVILIIIILVFILVFRSSENKFFKVGKK